MYRSAFAAMVALLACAGSAPAQEPAPQSVPAPAPQARGYTGFTIRFSMTTAPGGREEEGHPVVAEVHPGSPAAKAGFAPGDVVLEVGGRDSREFGAMRVQPGGRYTYRVRRGEDERELILVAVPRPAHLDQPRP
jgi:S1-C subfamily serine protease